MPASANLAERVSDLLMRASDWVHGLAGGSGLEFSGDQSISQVALADERLRPKAPMPKDDIDIVTRLQLSHRGYRNPQSVTAESHPELYAAWQTLCHRAGYAKPPQLMITESRVPQASAMNSGEMMVSTGLLQLLNLREVVGVLGHELGHGRRNHNGPRVAASLVFGTMGALVGDHLGARGGMALPTTRWKLPRWLGGSDRLLEQYYGHAPQRQPSSVLATLGFIAGGAALGNVFANQVSVKPTELQADLDGVAISGDPEALASAFAKMQAVDKRNPVARWFGYMRSGYPTMDERIANIHRAAIDMPPNPVAAVLGPVPQVSDVVHAARVVAPEADRRL